MLESSLAFHHLLPTMKALFRLAPILAALTSPALAGDGLVAQRPEFQVGDRFTYADRFETVACKDWKVEQVDEAGNLLMVRCGDNVATLAPDGGILRITGKDGKTLVSFSPRAAAIPFPLQIGQALDGAVRSLRRRSDSRADH